MKPPIVSRTERAIAYSFGHAEVRFTTRIGGISSPPFDSLNLGDWLGDDKSAVLSNQAEVLAVSGLYPADLAQTKQIHGNRVLRVGSGPDQVSPGTAREDAPEADGVASGEPLTPCMVLAADCMPVMLVGPSAVCAVHAGWRGLVAGVLERGVEAMKQLHQEPEELVAIIGPSARSCCYEVGPEVHAELEQFGDFARVGNNADLTVGAMMSLANVGVEEVIVDPHCTICTPELFYSHRRDGVRSGRQAGLVWLR